ncbi:uncharacterized protein G2W53_041948 [Senna tora]|uniref:Uncharacterized protein n=1 Tax=Senna tora TaxID=362788 RepID=A0A834VZ57_9FABA|nr:uncharacterized protein G2W53_041948 [Senna tora]
MLQLESTWHGWTVDHAFTYTDRQITVGSQKLSRITRQKSCCPSESNTSVRVVFANRSGFDAPIPVFMAWEERGSCLNIFRMQNRGRILETFPNYEAKDLLRKNLHELQGKRLVAQVSQTHRFALYMRSGVVLMLQLESSWHGRRADLVLTYSGRQIAVGSQKPSRITRCVDHVLTYSRQLIAIGSQKPSRIMRQNTCCTCESNNSVRVVFANQSGFDAPIRVVFASEERGSCRNIFQTTNRGRLTETITKYEAKDLLRKIVDQVLTYSGRKSRSDLRDLHELRGKSLVAQVSQTRRFALYLRTGVVLMLQLESSRHGRSVDHVLTYSGRKIAVGSQKPSRITRQKTCCPSESNTSVRVVFANRSGLDAPIGVVLAWEERGSCIKIFQMTITVESQKHSRIMRQKFCCASKSNRSVRVVFANRSGFDVPIAVILEWEDRGSCLNIFRTKNHVRISEKFTNYEAKDLLRNRHGMGGPWIMSLHIPVDKSRSDLRNLHELRGKSLDAQKRSRITRQKTCCASESNTSVRIVFANRSGFDAPIGVDMAWEDRGSCLYIYRSTNHGRISETFTNYEAKVLMPKQKTFCASESNTSVRVVFANHSGFDAQIGVMMAWEERGSCLNIFRMTNRGRISKIFTNYEAKDLLRNESNTSVRVVFANRSGFDAPVAVILAWEKRGSCINKFRMTTHGRILETFTNYEAKDLLRNESNTSVRVVFANRSGFDAPIGVVLAWEDRGSLSQTRRFALYLRTGEVLMLELESSWHGRSVDLVLTYSERQIAVRAQKPLRITRQKTCCASESNTLVRVGFENRSGFDAPIGVVFAWEERGSCLNIFRMKKLRSDLRNLHELRGKRLVAQLSQTRLFALYLRTVVVLMLQWESSWHGRSVDHVLTYSGRQIAVRSHKPSRITRQKTCSASESNTSVRVVFTNRRGFDAPIGVVLAWEEHGSCINIFRMTNRGQISETFTNYEAKDLLRKSMDHVLTYSGRQIVVGSHKPSRITRQKTCCASESNTSVRVVLANRSGFDAPIGVVLAWEERGSCLNIFRTTNHGRISETFTNYEAKDSLRK